ncbi:Zinc finger, RING-type [Dillenia turbinata]|uniref:RING-type E3 ubiquitin transferase n=1 Tax=Dillenia turbinata TaxID=194707 RepID=A0AAN8W467_9MAGN
MEDSSSSSVIAPTSNYALNGKIMLCSSVALFSVIIIIILLRFYAPCFIQRRRSRRRNNHRFHDNNNNSSSVSTGLEVSVLGTLPVVVCGKNDAVLSECAICLSEFEENQKGRVLPKCGHAFHVDCIDVWFSSHSNCPLCRAPVQPDGNRKEAVIDVPEPTDPQIYDEIGSVGSESASPPAVRTEGLESPEGWRLSLKRIWSVW